MRLQLLFRSVNKLLMDTATSEYLFCSDFFQEAAVFHELFAPTLRVVESALAATLPVSCVLCCAVLCCAAPCCLLLCFACHAVLWHVMMVPCYVLQRSGMLYCARKVMLSCGMSYSLPFCLVLCLAVPCFAAHIHGASPAWQPSSKYWLLPFVVPCGMIQSEACSGTLICTEAVDCRADSQQNHAV